MIKCVNNQQIRTDKISILIADDHQLMRYAIRSYLEKQPDFKILAECTNGEEIVKLAQELLPNVIILDITMPKINGIEATKLIKAKCPNTSILVLTIHDDSRTIMNILEAGADGYITKKIFGEDLPNAVRTVMCGESVFSRDVREQIVKGAIQEKGRDEIIDDGIEQLTKREVTILKLVAQGRSNKQIAVDLSMNLRTVKAYIANIFLKLRTSSRTEAVTKALRENIISMQDTSQNELT